MAVAVAQPKLALSWTFGMDAQQLPQVASPWICQDLGTPYPEYVELQKAAIYTDAALGYVDVSFDGKKKSVLRGGGSMVAAMFGSSWMSLYRQALHLTETMQAFYQLDVNIMELYMIGHAVVYAQEHPGMRYYILSDSDRALHALWSVRLGHQANPHSRVSVIMHRLAATILPMIDAYPGQICLRWVRGHVGSRLNEEADWLAKHAAYVMTSDRSEAHESGDRQSIPVCPLDRDLDPYHQYQ